MAYILHVCRPGMIRRGTRTGSGFTLTELMIVVVILGILATIAIVSFRKYVQHAKKSEVFTILGDIRAKQEGYRAEFSQYCDVGGSHGVSSGGAYPATPRADGGKTVWGTPPVSWQQLGFTTHSAVYGGYSVGAGLPGMACASGCPGGFPITDHWWIAWGLLDLDGDGNFGTYEALMATTDVAVFPDEGE